MLWFGGDNPSHQAMGQNKYVINKGSVGREIAFWKQGLFLSVNPGRGN